MQDLKKLFWYIMVNSTFKDVRDATLHNKTFLKELKNEGKATIHLKKKHFPVVVKSTINELLSDLHYEVTSMEYHFHGMDVIVSRK